MNLMLSFILRYTSFFVNGRVVADYYDFGRITEALRVNHGSLMENDVLRNYCEGSDTMACRAVTILVHYAVLTTFFWLLVEGVYLQLVINRNSTGIKSFAHFIVLGWGLPLIPTIIWVILKAKMETAKDRCWEDFVGGHLWVVISVPIFLSILINFFFFINVIRIGIFKLPAHNMTGTDYRLARSTLTLILLMGIPYVAFGVIHFLSDFDSEQFKAAYMMRVLFQLTFVSIQGALVAILYCFINSEVQKEIKKFIRTWRRRNLGQEFSESYSEQLTSAIPLNTKEELLDNNKPHYDVLA